MTGAARLFAIVDGFSSGTLLTRQLLEAGHRCIDVQSSPVVPGCYTGSYSPELFSRHPPHHGNLDETVERLASFSPHFVIPGAETGVELADELSERLGLVSNGTAKSPARRDKFLMVEALRAQGIRTVTHFKSAELAAIVAWITATERFPVVLKPVKSAGADSVAICNSLTEVETAYHRIVGHTNQLGLRNEEVIVQGFLDGREYIVNSVSRDGKHYFCDLWECRKERLSGAGFISCLEELLPPEGELPEILTAYAALVLDALGIAHGPAHMEVMVTAAGPVLIEVGARVQGAIHPPSIQAATGTNQIALTVEAYTAPERLLGRAGKPYRLEKYLYHHFLLSNVEGALAAMPGLDGVKALPSFFHYVPRVKLGEPIRRTVDLFSSAGVVDLLNADRAILERDYQELRRLEKETLFRVC